MIIIIIIIIIIITTIIIIIIIIIIIVITIMYVFSMVCVGVWDKEMCDSYNEERLDRKK